jgi:pilus assembly protein CpaB
MYLRNILLAIGVLALVSGASLAVLWLTQRPAQIASSSAGVANHSAAQTNAKTILTAAHAIPPGTLLRAEDVAWKEIPSDPMPQQIVRDAAAQSKYLGAVTTQEFAAGDPLTTTALIKPGDRGFLAALLAPGMRAVSIVAEATQSDSGLLLPDNRVDIILTQTFENSSDLARKSVGETILRNLRVIAVDQRLGAAPIVAGKTPSPEVSIPKILTLEVTEREAETLMVASRLGRLEVAMRSFERVEGARSGEDDAVVPLWAADVSPALKTMRRAIPMPAAVEASAVVAAPIPTARKSIEVMHGSKTEAR